MKRQEHQAPQSQAIIYHLSLLSTPGTSRWTLCLSTHIRTVVYLIVNMKQSLHYSYWIFPCRCSVVDLKLLSGDSDQTFQIISDPDRDPVWIRDIFDLKNFVILFTFTLFMLKIHLGSRSVRILIRNNLLGIRIQQKVWYLTGSGSTTLLVREFCLHLYFNSFGGGLNLWQTNIFGPTGLWSTRIWTVVTFALRLPIVPIWTFKYRRTIM